MLAAFLWKVDLMRLKHCEKPFLKVDISWGYCLFRGQLSGLSQSFSLSSVNIYFITWREVQYLILKLCREKNINTAVNYLMQYLRAWVSVGGWKDDILLGIDPGVELLQLQQRVLLHQLPHHPWQKRRNFLLYAISLKEYRTPLECLRARCKNIMSKSWISLTHTSKSKNVVVGTPPPVSY